MTQNYRITLLPGDGIGPEIINVAVDVLKVVGKQFDLQFEFQQALMGGAAIDATGEPLPADTLEMCRNSDAILLAAVGGYKWDSLPSHLRPEAGLLGLRAGLGLFANLRPAKIIPQLIDASTLKKKLWKVWILWWCANSQAEFTLVNPREFLRRKLVRSAV